MRHLDLKRITEDERVAAAAALSSRQSGSQYQTRTLQRGKYFFPETSRMNPYIRCCSLDKDSAAGDARTKVSGQHRPGSAMEDKQGRGFDVVDSLGRDVAGLGLGLGELKSSEAMDMDMYPISSSMNKAINLARNSNAVEFDGGRPSEVAAKELERSAGGETSKYGKLSATDVFLGFEVSTGSPRYIQYSTYLLMALYLH